MRLTRILWQHRQPSIRFIGKRSIPKQLDHSPHAHPAAPDSSLPESFAQYRGRAIQHGPLAGQQQQQQQQKSAPKAGSGGPSSSASPAVAPYGAIGGHSGKQLGSVKPAEGEFWDREELPARFRRRKWSEDEIEAVDTAGASMWG